MTCPVFLFLRHLGWQLFKSYNFSGTPRFNPVGFFKGSGEWCHTHCYYKKSIFLIHSSFSVNRFDFFCLKDFLFLNRDQKILGNRNVDVMGVSIT